MRAQDLLATFVLVTVMALPCFSQSKQTRQAQLQSHIRLAQQYLREGKPELAVPELRTIVAMDPRNVDARGNLGVLLYFQNKYAESVPQLRAALKLQPSLWKIQALLGLAESRLGQQDAGLKDLQTAFPHLEDEKIKMEVGNDLVQSYTSTGDLDSAAAIVASMLKTDPTNVNLLYTAYRLHSDLADQAMLTLALVAPNSARMHQVMAHELARHDEKAAAIANYKEAIKLDPQLPGLHFELGEMYYNSSDPALQAQAENQYKQALAITPTEEKAASRLGEIAAKRGDTQQAMAYFSRALQLQPNDAETDIDLAKVMLSLNRPQEAETLLQKAIQIDPTDYIAHYRLSTLYRQQGHMEESKKELAEYEKYKNMKEKLRNIFHQMRVQTGKVETDKDAREAADATR